MFVRENTCCQQKFKSQTLQDEIIIDDVKVFILDALCFYFGIDVNVSEEKSKQIVEIGDLAYWPPGRALCIFFGPTPASLGKEPRAASPVNVFGKITSDSTAFRKVKSGEEITIDSAE
jgi:hypothetical protein